jgi:hypothetical protein
MIESIGPAAAALATRSAYWFTLAHVEHVQAFDLAHD